MTNPGHHFFPIIPQQRQSMVKFLSFCAQPGQLLFRLFPLTLEFIQAVLFKSKFVLHAVAVLSQFSQVAVVVVQFLAGLLIERFRLLLKLPLLLFQDVNVFLKLV